MLAQRFLIVGWSLQLFAGCILFIISLYFEARVLTAFFQSAGIAWALATALEMGKALAIVWFRLNVQLLPTAVSLKLLSACFRIGLIAFSVLCTLLFLANYLDRPALQQAANADRVDLQKRHSQESRLLKEKNELWRIRLVEDHERRTIEIDDLYKPRIESLREKLNVEMDNVVKGKFKGPRYREFERLLALELDRHVRAVDSVNSEFDYQMENRNAEIKTSGESLLARQKEESTDLALRNYSLDERANDPHITALINLFTEVFDASPQPLQIVFFFSLLLSLLVELGIWLAFDTVTSYLLPELSIQRGHDQMVAQRKYEAQAERAAQESQAKQAMEKVARKARQTIETAKLARNSIDNAA